MGDGPEIASGRLYTNWGTAHSVSHQKYPGCTCCRPTETRRWLQTKTLTLLPIGDMWLTERSAALLEAIMWFPREPRCGVLPIHNR